MRFSTVHLNCLLRLKSKQQKNQDCTAVDLLLCVICVPMNGSLACGRIHVPVRTTSVSLTILCGSLCVGRWQRPWTTSQCFTAREGSTEKQSRCVRELWRSERRCFFRVSVSSLTTVIRHDWPFTENSSFSKVDGHIGPCGLGDSEGGVSVCVSPSLKWPRSDSIKGGISEGRGSFDNRACACQ